MEQSSSSSSRIVVIDQEAADGGGDEVIQRSRSRSRNRRRLGLRRRKILSPLSRGLLLAIMFGGWICVSVINGGGPGMKERDAGQGQGQGQGTDNWRARTLLNASSDSTSTSTSTSESEVKGNEVMKKGQCLAPAIEQFPEAFMNKWLREHGGLIVHILVAVYMFVGLAIACDDYFVPSLDKIADVLNLPPDVAGATFMAAGSSGPELATAVIGVFVAQDDIGVSGVIGSAVFNITLVIAVCALAAEQVLYLSWWSVVRDCSCYLISILVLLLTIANEIISWPEAFFFLVLYVAYCVGMAFNSPIEAWAKQRLPVPESWNLAGTQQGGTENYGDMDKNAAKTNGANKNNMEMRSTSATATATGSDGLMEIPMSPPNPDPRAPELHAVEPIDDPLEKPMDGDRIKLVKWAVLYPLYFACKYTIPDCRQERFTRFFVATFLASIAWISLFSYMMVWMITVIGYTLGIPDTVMGLTFIAAGVSVPDALSGIAVVKEGHGDMAVSNAIGSNVFDILVCLGIPWFLETAVVDPGSYVRVRSKGLFYSTFSLFSTVVFLIVASHYNGWKLDKRFGIILLVWYFIFMVFASMYELNIFGEFNPPECQSKY